ncbi:MAG: DUF4142 domain-containing protein [Acidobacteriota bacterium]|nr:DUF4142 domain-containing protein [Acidobacteriota bacterium]
MRLNGTKLGGQVRGSLVAMAGMAILSIVPAMAQQNPGMQQPANPQQQQPTAGVGAGNDSLANHDSNGSNGSHDSSAMSGANGANGMSGSQGMGGGKGMDKMFVRKALEGGMAEVQLGQLALQKSSNDEVKQFAQKMVDDHTKMGDDLKPIAQQMNVKVPDGPSAKDKATMAKLQALNGDAFDKAYVKDMVKDHKADQREFKEESTRTTNPDLKQASTHGLEVVTEHLQMIEQIASKNNVASK